MTAPARHLHVIVNEETGERQEFDACPGCAERDVQIQRLEHDLRGKRLAIAKLQADRNADARKDALWPRCARHFQLWRELTSHTRTELTGDRFWLAHPFLRRFDDLYINTAIRGLAFDPYKSERLRNGSIEVYNDWEHLFKNESALRRYHGRAPVPRELVLADVELPPHELNLASYAPDGATPWHGPLAAGWADA